ncbi:MULTISPECIES: 3-isopropylmalate dehydratase large subunit [unclassified Methanoculleus]|uniref:3-isopropylmalate dehydratase large subunit n=1 Tax=unclassified Methanoculleus TaxID=2619537 RepID=UPI0025CCA0DA|nr:MULTISPECIES: 3-isopropylmalate dehydratase large subunit [unclassified Methanoculleus]MCK9317924.1 3-isopropylmalate dehydratase large subunit [Methanoculleus sp.]MDD2253714.1 3-isopropylmalate dehydratase large subunit [Methanoculleus sp.]MDD2788152.1 3-isopropylmalate dehydratase large subunit [Methanoculleus sp.]MDD3216987.1 3-isopropylmalate dehydratase large subunit [Methanoculleus sp.]MDD4314485.1 3-isopropylmalate dehydratase large subunit [Methanoculleus sp.]
MAATIAEKIFSMKCGSTVRAGDVVMAPVDAAMIHDITGPLAVRVFGEMGGEHVFDPERIIMLFDHQVPADSIPAAENHVFMRQFAEEQEIHNYDLLEGVCHQVVMEKGRAAPGEIIVGTDSHTCTYGAAGAFATGIGSTDMGFVLKFGALYFRVPESILIEVNGTFGRRVGPKDLILSLAGDIGADGATYMALEFAGRTMEKMNMAGRMTCANMVIEMGAKAGIVRPDAATWDYVAARRAIEPFDLAGDPDAAYRDRRHYDVTDLAPQVAVPHNVDNVVDVTKVAGTKVDQVFIGSCTNGRYEDLFEAAEVMGSADRFASGVRVIVIPASRTEYLKALRAGLIERFVEAGALVEAPCCGPCMGGAFGLLAPGEVSLSTSNRNFRGRQGSTQARVYLASPATAAASALYGEITDPREV